MCIRDRAGFAAVALAATQGLGASLAPVDFLVFLVISLRYFRALGDLGLNLAEWRHARDTLAHIRALAAEPEPVSYTHLCLAAISGHPHAKESSMNLSKIRLSLSLIHI